MLSLEKTETADNKYDIKNKDNLNNLCARPTLALAIGEQKLSPLPLSNVGEAEMLSMLSLEKTETLSSNTTPVVGCRSAADVEIELTQLLLKSQKEHEEIILEVTDYRPGTLSGYNTPCPRELQQHIIDGQKEQQRYEQYLQNKRRDEAAKRQRVGNSER